MKIILTHFNQMLHFYTPGKRQKTFGFLTLSRGIEMENWVKNGLILYFFFSATLLYVAVF